MSEIYAVESTCVKVMSVQDRGFLEEFSKLRSPSHNTLWYFFSPFSSPLFSLPFSPPRLHLFPLYPFLSSPISLHLSPPFLPTPRLPSLSPFQGPPLYPARCLKSAVSSPAGPGKGLVVHFEPKRVHLDFTTCVSTKTDNCSSIFLRESNTLWTPQYNLIILRG